MPRRSTRPAALAVALALSLLASSCSKPKVPGNTAVGDEVTSTTNGSGDTGTTIASRSGTTARPGTPTTAGRKGTTNTTSGRTGTTNASSAPGHESDGSHASAGGYASTLLRPQPATRLVIEVFAQSGAAPLKSTLSHASDVLGQNSHKPVTVSGPIDVPGSSQAYSAAQIRDMADHYGRNDEANGQAVIHLLYLHGTYEGDDSILGISVRGDVAAVMVDQVKSAQSPVAPRSTIEDAVTEHELGHLLGLVDLVLHTGRGDPDHPGHSTNPNSVMYWAIESDLVSQVLSGPPPVDFDNADRADLAAIRNGA